MELELAWVPELVAEGLAVVVVGLEPVHELV